MSPTEQMTFPHYLQIAWVCYSNRHLINTLPFITKYVCQIVILFISAKSCCQHVALCVIGLDVWINALLCNVTFKRNCKRERRSHVTVIQQLIWLVRHGWYSFGVDACFPNTTNLLIQFKLSLRRLSNKHEFC